MHVAVLPSTVLFFRGEIQSEEKQQSKIFNKVHGDASKLEMSAWVKLSACEIKVGTREHCVNLQSSSLYSSPPPPLLPSDRVGVAVGSRWIIYYYAF